MAYEMLSKEEKEKRAERIRQLSMIFPKVENTFCAVAPPSHIRFEGDKMSSDTMEGGLTEEQKEELFERLIQQQVKPKEAVRGILHSQ